MTAQSPQDEVEEVARAMGAVLIPGSVTIPASMVMSKELMAKMAGAAIATIDRLRSAAPAAEGWRPIATATFDGSPALVYRPLAHKTHDAPIAIKMLIGGNNHCWTATVPKGAKPFNPTDGSCHVTHYMPLPTPPKEKTHG